MDNSDIEIAINTIKDRLCDLENGSIRIEPADNESKLLNSESKKLLDKCKKYLEKIEDIERSIDNKLRVIHTVEEEIKTVSIDMSITLGALLDHMDIAKPNLRRNYNKVPFRIYKSLVKLFELES